MEASDSITVVKDFLNEPNQLMRVKQIIDENLFSLSLSPVHYRLQRFKLILLITSL